MPFPVRRPAAIVRLLPPLRFRLIAATVALAASLHGCTSPPPAQSVAAADPAAPIPGTSYRPALGAYRSTRPAEPATWRDRNDQAAPKRSGQ